MQPLTQVFLALLIAHLVGDFPLQTRRMVEGKVAGRAAAFARHLGVHLALTVVALLIFVPATLATGVAWLAVGLLVAGHLLLDLGKSAIVRRLPALDRWPLFVIDQLLHVAIVAAAAILVTGERPDVAAGWAWWLANRDAALVVIVVLLISVFPAGYLIRYLLTPLSRELAAAAERDHNDGHSIASLTNAGLYLGWVERALLVIAFAANSFTAVGFIIGAKSVARYPEFRSRDFAEYFLIGSLISVLIAALGGYVMRIALATV